MDGLKEKILELASQDEDFAKELAKAETIEAAAEMLREKGLDVTPEDLQPSEVQGKAKLSDDELEAVSGGIMEVCICVAGGFGDGDGSSSTCACVVAGYGKNLGGDSRCICWFDGGGDDQ